jgi:predicted transcriptional regulator
VIPVPIAFKILPRCRQKLYYSSMTKLLEQALETVRGLPPEIQDELAHMLLQFAGEDQPLLQLSPEEEASLDESLAQADSGEFATDEQVRAIWAKRNL